MDAQAQDRESARSMVRRVVTYTAAGYVFGGGMVLTVAAFVPSVSASTMETARTAYMLCVPLASMVIGWWFAKRDEERAEEPLEIMGAETER